MTSLWTSGTQSGLAGWEFICPDIGEVGEWGFPKDWWTKYGGVGDEAIHPSRHRWWHYFDDAFYGKDMHQFDVILLDALFRVASGLHALLTCRPDAIVFVDDYFRWNKYGYAHLAEFYNVTRVANLARMTRKPGPLDETKIRGMLKWFEFDCR